MRSPLPPPKAVGAAGIGLLLIACANNLVNPEIPPPGAPAYKEGYLDGCASGFAVAPRVGAETDCRRDETRYASDGEYRRGWETGLNACYAEEQRHPKMCGPGPELLSCGR
jgi:hypothetical protein